MALLYYTTEYTPARAQAEIQKLLLQIGARRISHEFDPRTRDVVGISFELELGDHVGEYVLPARVDQVRVVLERQGVLRGNPRRGRPDPRAQRQHAQSVAWKTLLEWLRLQAAIIETEQAKPDEVMLPYMLVDRNGQRMTVYQQFAQVALPAPTT